MRIEYKQIHGQLTAVKIYPCKYMPVKHPKEAQPRYAFDLLEGVLHAQDTRSYK